MLPPLHFFKVTIHRLNDTNAQLNERGTDHLTVQFSDRN
jgi:hypothetical protein